MARRREVVGNLFAQAGVGMHDPMMRAAHVVMPDAGNRDGDGPARASRLWTLISLDRTIIARNRVTADALTGNDAIRGRGITSTATRSRSPHTHPSGSTTLARLVP